MPKARSKKRSWYPILISLPISLLGMYVYILHAHRYKHDGIIILAFFMSFSFPLVFQTGYLNVREDKWYGRLFNGLLMALCCLPFIFGMIRLEDYYCRYQLEHYPSTVSATVSGFETERYKGGSTYYAIFNYTFKGKQYTQHISNRDSSYKLEDSLVLQISAKDPEIYIIQDVWRTESPE